MLKKLLSAKQCASCRICCSFVEADAWEAPTFTDPVTNEKYREEYVFKDKEEILLCPMLDEHTGCRLGDDKPFECRLWPLRVFAENGGIIIGVSKMCPAFKEEDDDKLLELLQDGLFDVISDEIKRNPEAVRKECGGYRKIASIPANVRLQKY